MNENKVKNILKHIIENEEKMASKQGSVMLSNEMKNIAIYWNRLKKEVLYPDTTNEEYIAKEFTLDYFENINPVSVSLSISLYRNSQETLLKSIFSNELPKDALSKFLWDLVVIYEYENFLDEFSNFVEEELMPSTCEKLKLDWDEFLKSLKATLSV